MSGGGIWKFAIVIKLEAGLVEGSCSLSSPLLSLMNSTTSATDHSVFGTCGFGKLLTPCNEKVDRPQSTQTKLI